MTAGPLTQLEREVIEAFLAGEDPILEVLRQQFSTCDVAEREMTGVGFYASLRVPETIPRLAGHPEFKIGDVHAEVMGLQHGAGFLLYVENGVLDLLEGYTYDGPWPPTIQEFNVSYIGGPHRDLDEVRKGWS